MRDWIVVMLLIGFPWAVTLCWMLDGGERMLQRVTRARTGGSRDGE